MRGWLILIAVSALFGFLAIGLGGGADVSEPLLAEPIRPASPEPDANPGSPPEPVLPVATVNQTPHPLATQTPAARVPSVQADPAGKIPPVPENPAPLDPELVSLLAEMRERLAAMGTVPKEAVLDLADHLAANRDSAARVLHLMFEASTGLGRLRPFVFQAVLDSKDQTLIADLQNRIREKSAAAMRRLPATLEGKRTALASGDEKIQALVVKNLKKSDLRDTDVLEWLKSVAEDTSESWKLRRLAIHALGRTPDLNATSTLITLFTASAEDLERASILRALARRGTKDPRIAQTFIDQVFDRQQSPAVRRFAVMGLKAFKTPEARETLLYLLKNETDKYVRRHAMAGLRAHLEAPGIREALRLQGIREKDDQIKALIGRLLSSQAP